MTHERPLIDLKLGDLEGTVFYYKGKEASPKKIDEELGVQAVLLGRVGGRGDDLELNLELVNTNTQNVIWVEKYVNFSESA